MFKENFGGASKIVFFFLNPDVRYSSVINYENSLNMHIMYVLLKSISYFIKKFFTKKFVLKLEAKSLTPTSMTIINNDQ